MQSSPNYSDASKASQAVVLVYLSWYKPAAAFNALLQALARHMMLLSFKGTRYVIVM